MSEPRDEEIARLYAQADRPEPPAQFDAAILAASRRAVGAGPRARTPSRRWAAPFALAATIVLAVAVSVLVSRERPDLTTDEAGPPATATTATTPPAAAETAVPAREASRGPATGAARRDARPERTREAGRISPATPPPTAKPVEDAGGSSAIPAEAPAPQAAPAAVAQPAPALRDLAREQSERAAGNLESDAAQRSSSMQQAPSAARRPAERIEVLRKLKAEGRTADFERELAAFRREYPDYRLPEDLTRP